MKRKTLIIRKYGETDFITGLRAIAATLVVVIHTGAFVDFGIIGSAITYSGKYGVDIFFVISGFTIAKTYAEASSYQSYLGRRLFRILPLYWLVISVAILLWSYEILSPPPTMQDSGSASNTYNYLIHLSMLSFLDYRVANSILGVEWTIPVEIFWYIALPPLIYYSKSVGRTICASLFLLTMTAALSYLSKELYGSSQPIKWSPIAHGHLFFIGALSYHLRCKFSMALETSYRGTMWVRTALLSFILALTFDFPGRAEVLVLSTAIFMTWLSPKRGVWIARTLTVRPILFLGSISYSIYLIHMLVIYALKDFDILPAANFERFLLVYGLTLCLSTVSYLAIERPTNNLGKRIIKRNGRTIR